MQPCAFNNWRRTGDQIIDTSYIWPPQDPHGRHPLQTNYQQHQECRPTPLRLILTSSLGKLKHHVKNAPDFADKARSLKLNTVSYDVTSQFTCIPPLRRNTRVRKRLAQDFRLSNRTRLSRL